MLNASKLCVELQGHYCDLSGRALSKGILSVEWDEDEIKFVTDPFLYRYDFKLVGVIGEEEIVITKEDINEVIVRRYRFFYGKRGAGSLYRLYEPDCRGKTPLVLFLHGGGECGTDNELQLTGTLGAMKLAQRWSEMYVMAPQAPSGTLSMEENFKVMKRRGNPSGVEMGMTPFALKGERGWNRDYLGKVVDIIVG